MITIFRSPSLSFGNNCFIDLKISFETYHFHNQLIIDANLPHFAETYAQKINDAEIPDKHYRYILK
jgi:hypothetical protein